MTDSNEYSAREICDSGMAYAMSRAFSIAESVDQKTPLQATAKLAEELGELMREVLIVEGTPGCVYRGSSRGKLVEETADVMLCLLAVMRKLNIQPGDIALEMQRKSEKWVANSGVKSED